MANERDMIADVGEIEGGKIIFAPDVIATISTLAATEVDGVESMSGTVVDGITGMLSKKSLTKGVRVDLSEQGAAIDLSVMIRYGYKIHEVAANIQKKVKSTLETMTGLNVIAINVMVASISFEKPEKNRTVIEDSAEI